jgi:DNA polymerase alpha subunit A
VKLYDEVDEEKYKSIVRGRLQQDDFVVNDGVDGYMDNGMEDWIEGDDVLEVEEKERKKKRESVLFLF